MVLHHQSVCRSPSLQRFQEPYAPHHISFSSQQHHPGSPSMYLCLAQIRQHAPFFLHSAIASRVGCNGVSQGCWRYCLCAWGGAEQCFFFLLVCTFHQVPNMIILSYLRKKINASICKFVINASWCNLVGPATFIFWTI